LIPNPAFWIPVLEAARVWLGGAIVGLVVGAWLTDRKWRRRIDTTFAPGLEALDRQTKALDSLCKRILGEIHEREKDEGWRQDGPA
jgi:hypothetical protein